MSRLIDRPALDVSALPTLTFGSRQVVWWGNWGIIAIEGTMFGILIASFLYLRFFVAAWPPPGVAIPGLLLPTSGLIVMLLACLPAYYAGEAAKKNDAAAALVGLVLNLIGIVVALVIRYVEWKHLNFRWTDGAHGSIVWMVLGLHTTHLVTATIETTFFVVLTAMGRLGDRQRLGIEVESIYWYFVAVAWIPLYALIYIVPRALPKG